MWLGRFRPYEKEEVRLRKLNGLAERPIQISFLSNLPDAAQLLWRAVADRDLTLDSVTAESDTAADAEATFTLKIGSTTVATIVWPAAGTTAACTIVNADIADASTLKLTAPSPQDATLKDGTIILTFKDAN